MIHTVITNNRQASPAATSQQPQQQAESQAHMPPDIGMRFQTIKPAYDIQNLSVNYAGKPALRNVNLTLPADHITALIGPSGCGKSTFLQTLCRLTDHLGNCQTQGNIQLMERCLWNEHSKATLHHEVGFIFQQPCPFPTSIAKNLHIPLREHGVKNKHMRMARVQQALQDVGLWQEVKDRLHQPAIQLSGGQQQRLCIARALVLRPKILLMDEPCSALDPMASQVIEDLILQLRKNLTIIVVTHNLAQARRIADFTGLFWVQAGESGQPPAGELIEFGSTTQLFNHPQHALTKAYIEGRQG